MTVFLMLLYVFSYKLADVAEVLIFCIIMAMMEVVRPMKRRSVSTRLHSTTSEKKSSSYSPSEPEVSLITVSLTMQ
jgi:hypothetical protein